MKKQKCVYVDKERSLRFMEPSKTFEIEAGNLLADMYSRKKAEGGVFFGVDTVGQYTRLENLQTNQDGLSPERKKYLRKAWEHPFDIDFLLEYGADAETAHRRVYHEVKSAARTLDADGKVTRQYGGKDADGRFLYGRDGRLYAGWEEVAAHTRGMIPLELVSDMQMLQEHGGHLKDIDGEWVSIPAQEQTDTVPGTDLESKHLPGQGWGFKGTVQADYFHFYLPMRQGNEGRITADAKEIERMQTEAGQGAKLITEAPAGLFITISWAVKEALYGLARQWFADEFEKVTQRRSLTERRELLEEFWEKDNKGRLVVRGVNVSVPVTMLVSAWEQVYNNTGRGALLEIRPVVKYIRNGTQGEEIEVADNGQEYWIPERLQAVYFSQGALKRKIQGYWDDSPKQARIDASGAVEYGRRLLATSFGFESRVRDFHVVAPESEEDEDVTPKRV